MHMKITFTALLLLVSSLAHALDAPKISREAGVLFAFDIPAGTSGFNIFKRQGGIKVYIDTIPYHGLSDRAEWSTEIPGDYCYSSFDGAGQYSSCSNYIEYLGSSFYVNGPSTPTTPAPTIAPQSSSGLICVTTTVTIDGVSAGTPNTECY